MDDRNRAAPVALPGDAPVAQLVVDLPLGLRAAADRHRLQAARHLFLGRVDRHPVEKAGIDHQAVAVVGDRVDGEGRGVDVGRADDRGRSEAVDVDEVEVALIVRRTAENRARAVIHQDEIRHIDRQAPVRVERMNDPEAGVVALLLRGLDRGDRGADLAAFLDERGERRIAPGGRGGERMVGRDRHEFRAEQRVRARRVDFEFARGRFAGERSQRRRVDDETDHQAFRAPDPVALHQAHLFRPAVEAVEAREQIVGIVGDPEEPLGQFALLDHRARAPAAAVDHLLVGEHGVVDRIPVHLRLPPRNEARREGNRERASADACSNSGRRSRSRATSRATAPSTAVARASHRYWRRSMSPDGCCSASRRFPPACRTRPTPSGEGRCSRARAGIGRRRRPSHSCARGPYGCAPTDRETSRGRNIWAGDRRCAS